MDIVNLDRSMKRRQKRRRNPEEDQSLRRENSLSLSDENISSDVVVDSNTLKKVESSVPLRVRDTTQEPLSSSWNSLFDVGDFESPSESDYQFFEGSQVTSFQGVSSKPRSGKYDVAKHQYQLSYELALDNVLTPFADNGSTLVSPLVYSSKLKHKLSHIEHVIQEMVSTEKVYIEDLSQVVDGYQVPLVSHVGVLPVRSSDLQELFGNIHEILDFHRSLLASLEESGNDSKKIATCFLSSAEDFKIYTHYCNNYPKSVNTLTRLSQDSAISPFLKRCQQRLNHMLPLGAYLLKPVQRVLKYSLLLTDMLKHIKRDDPSYSAVKDAIQKMTAVAEHINSMKRKYDAAVHVQEVQSLIRGNEGLDLRTYGDLLHEDNFRYLGGKSATSTFRGRSERYVFLFQKLCLITKKEEVGYQYKAHLEMKDMQLTEKIDKDPNSFHIRQVSSGRSYTFQARSLEQKLQWVRSIKLQLMESLPDLPDKAKELILRGFPTSESPSPRIRHRHYSEEPTLPSMMSPKVEIAVQKSKTLGHGFQPSSLIYSGKKQRGRTASSPSTKLVKQLAQATLTGFLATTVHQENVATERVSQRDVSLESDVSVGESSNSGRSETSDHNEFPLASSPEGNFTGPVETETSTRQDQKSAELNNVINHQANSSPQPLHDGLSHSESVEGPFKTTADEEDLKNSPTVEFEIVSTTFGSEQPDVEVHVEQDQHVTYDDEALFDELMSSPSNIPPFDGNTTPPFSSTLLDHITDNIHYPSPTPDTEQDEDPTPKASPSNIRRWSVSKRPSNDAGYQVTSKAASSIKDPLSSSRGKPVRRHSFGSKSQHKIHRKQGSLSTDTTPFSSPYLHDRRKTSQINHQPTTEHQPNTRVPGVDTKSSATATELIIEDIVSTVREHQVEEDRKSIILPPPIEFDHHSGIESPLGHVELPCEENTSLGSPIASTNTYMPQIVPYSPSHDVQTPCESNPEEMVTFDEILQSFDHYSDTTGKTNKSSAHPSSPQVTKKEKKKRRNLTISDFDSTTMRLVKEEMRQYQDDGSGKKVKKLAREYSQRIKESHSLKRFSQVVEESPTEDLDKREPVWLRRLRERRKSKEPPRLKASDHVDPSESARCSDGIEPNTNVETDTECEQNARKGRFRGWVRSLVDRFSPNK